MQYVTGSRKSLVLNKLSKLVVVAVIIAFLAGPLGPVLVFAQEATVEAPTIETPSEVIESPFLSEDTTSPLEQPVLDEPEPEEAVNPEDDIENSGEEIKEDGDSKKPGNEPEALGFQVPQAQLPVPPSTVKQLLPESDLASGALTYSVPLVVPPGRNRLQPDLALSYNNQNMDLGNIFGQGWSINIPYIERINRKGSEKLYTENYFNSSLTGELNLISGSTWGSKVDNGEFLNYTFSSNVWTVKDKKGTTYKFGTNAAERQDNPSDSTKIYKWMLQEVRDLNDNYIEYTYYKDAGQIYPLSIFYTGSGTTDGLLEVEFSRQTRLDTTLSYKTAFGVTTNYRINEIQMQLSNSWMKKYVLGFTTGDNGKKSLLQTITESGIEGGNTVSLPATTFEYTTNTTTGWSDDTSNWTEPGQQMNPDRYQIADFNGDSKMDIIGGWYVLSGSQYRDVLVNTGNKTWSQNTGLAHGYDFIASDAGCNPVTWRDNGFRAFDFNGDLFTDILKAKDNPYGGFDAKTNSGTSFSTNSSWLSTIPFTVGCETNEYGTRVADLNGDGLQDILRQQDEGYPFSEQLNTGTGFATATSNWDTTKPLKSPQSQLVDINGDGLVDQVYSIFTEGPPSFYTNTTYLNKGDGTWAAYSGYASPLDLPLGAQNQEQGVRFADLNNDGLVDVFVDPTNDNPGVNKGTNLNTGTGWAYRSEWNLPSAFNNLFTTGAQATDINGDNLPDVFYLNGTGSMIAYVNAGKTVDILSKITYPTAGYSDITYKYSTNYKDGSNNFLNPNLPLNLNTVEKITHNDGLGNSWFNEYIYEGGKFYYLDAFDRKLSGFNKVTKKNSANYTTVTYYHQGDSTDSSNGEYSDHISKAGKIYRVELKDASGNIYYKQINKWDKYDLGNGRNFVKLVRTLGMSYDGDSDHKDNAAEFTYDNANGNLTSSVDWGEVTGADAGTFTDTGTDKFSSAITYASNTGLNILGLPSQETFTDQSANKVRESKYYYDLQTLGSVNKGNLTKQESWKTASTYIDIERTYNSYGLITQEKDPRDKATNYTYDTYNIYPATVTNPLSHVTSYTYDYSSGKVKQVTDPNTRVFQTIYDGLDRVVEEKQPDLTTPSTLVTKSTYTYTSQTVGNKIQKTDHLDGSTTVDSYTYTDGFDRPIQSRQEMEDSNTFAVTDTIYNNIEQVYKESLPYSSTGSAKTSATTTADLLTTYSYDPMMRVTSVVNAVGTTSNAYDDWKTSITDPRGKLKHLYKDARGNLIKVEETNSGSTYTTLYEYNGNNNLTKITDALSNIRNFTYDGLGRRLTAQDLHATADATFGTWTYTYDNSGNATNVVDPKSQSIDYTYDDINRMLTENYAGQAGTEVTNTYDSGTDGKGRLTSVTATGANTTTSYNALGGVKQEIKNINSTNYQTDFTYDRQGNQLEITNPDSSKVKYTYNTAGQMETVQRKETTDGSFINVVTDFDYGPHGKITYQAYQNGSATTNTYDAAKLYRISNKLTTITGGTKMQDNAYTYDANGNITKIIDNSQTNSKKTVDYVYDDLNRLSSATSTNAVNGQNYTQTYTYDAIGNILTKSDGAGTYSYNGHTGSYYANPHAVTSIGSGNLTYDNNGNTLTAPGSGGSVSWYSGSGTWTDRKQITVDETKIPGSTNLTDFPMLFSVTDPDLRTVANGGKVGKSDGTDILFTIDNTNKLSHEIEKYVATTGEFVAWVKVPSLLAASNTTLYTYFGNASAADQQNKNGTWNSNYKGVWHLKEAVTDEGTGTNTHTDSTSNNQHANQDGNDDATGKIGQSQIFDGTNDIVERARVSTATNNMTMSAWVKIGSAAPNSSRVVALNGERSGSGGNGYGIWVKWDSGESAFEAAFDLSFVAEARGTTNLSTETWYYVVGLRDAGTSKIYVNATSEGTTASTPSSPGDGFGIGAADDFSGNNSFLLGTVDEVRFSDNVRSADWITSEYNNQSSPSTFYSYGAVSGGSNTFTWDYNNRMTQAVAGSVTSTYTYDHSGQRVKLANGTTTTYYPSRFYNIEGSNRAKHIFAGDQLVATVTGTGASASIKSVHTDHLTGSNVVTNSGGTLEELMDYYPYGSIRLDEKSGSFSEQRKYAGHEYDADTGLSYMEARYYNGVSGKFVTQDQAFWDFSRLQKQLVDPQSWNSYAYGRNNPIKHNDPDGQFWDTVVDLGFTAWDGSKVLQHAGGWLGDQASIGLGKTFGNERLESNGRSSAVESAASLKSASGNLAFDFTATAVPGLPAFAGRIDDASKGVKFTAQQLSKMNLDGFLKKTSDVKLQNTLRKNYQAFDSLPGGTSGAIKNENLTGNPTNGIFHTDKGSVQQWNAYRNVLGRSTATKGDISTAKHLLKSLYKSFTVNGKSPPLLRK